MSDKDKQDFNAECETDSFFDKFLTWMFVIAVVAFVLSKTSNHLNKKNDGVMADLNTQIATLWNEVDSLINSKARLTEDSIQNTPEFKYVAGRQRIIDSMRQENTELIKSARKDALKASQITIVPNDEKVFSKFNNTPRIQNKGKKYFHNKKQIEEYDSVQQALNKNRVAARAYFDSTIHTAINERQLKINQLLNKKDSLINHKHK